MAVLCFKSMERETAASAEEPGSVFGVCAGDGLYLVSLGSAGYGVVSVCCFL